MHVLLASLVDLEKRCAIDRDTEKTLSRVVLGMTGLAADFVREYCRIPNQSFRRTDVQKSRNVARIHVAVTRQDDFCRLIREILSCWTMHVH